MSTGPDHGAELKFVVTNISGCARATSQGNAIWVGDFPLTACKLP